MSFYFLSSYGSRARKSHSHRGDWARDLISVVSDIMNRMAKDISFLRNCSLFSNNLFFLWIFVNIHFQVLNRYPLNKMSIHKLPLQMFMLLNFTTKDKKFYTYVFRSWLFLIWTFSVLAMKHECYCCFLNFLHASFALWLNILAPWPNFGWTHNNQCHFFPV